MLAVWDPGEDDPPLVDVPALISALEVVAGLLVLVALFEAKRTAMARDSDAHSKGVAPDTEQL